MQERVQKILASAGIASRRKCEELIAQGKVTVNGKTIKLGDKADIEKDSITLNNKKIALQKKVYLLFNKPKNVLSSHISEFGKKTIFDFVNLKERSFIVGRLDYDSEGLILLTNDGELAHRIMHPRYETIKEYEVLLSKPLSEKDCNTLKKGIRIEGKVVVPEQIFFKKDVAVITLHEGMKHIVKNLFGALGYSVSGLCRTKIANLELGSLASGSYRKLSISELKALKGMLHMEQ